jgi:radical SAM protein with 4Fe4S-binding SPASM domain
MELDIAKSAIERHFRDSNSFDELQIEFFGGEPFIQFELIQKICDWVWSKSWAKPYVFFATTNGTLIHGKIQDWFFSNKERFSLALSLDGLPEMHNHNRSGSFDKIDCRFFANTWPKQPVKMTVSRHSLPVLAQGVEFLHNMNFKIDGNLAYGIDWSDTANITLVADQMDKLVSFYINHPEIEPSGFLSMAIQGVTRESVPVKKWCGVGTEMVAVGIDGQEYPCHIFQPLSLGNKARTSTQISFTDFTSLQDERCANCVLLPICPTCYGNNYLRDGNPAIRDKGLCTLTKVRALACSKMHALKLQATPVTNIKDDDEAAHQLRIIRAIKTIQASIGLTIQC